jgi:hypothetical protein
MSELGGIGSEALNLCLVELDPIFTFTFDLIYSPTHFQLIILLQLFLNTLYFLSAVVLYFFSLLLEELFLINAFILE